MTDLAAFPMGEAGLELRILAAYENAISAASRGDHSEHARLWREFSRLHAQRSAQTVGWIERERGLSTR